MTYDRDTPCRFTLRHTFFSNCDPQVYCVKVTWDAASKWQTPESCRRPTGSECLSVRPRNLVFSKAPWTLTHLLEWPKSQTLTIPNAGDHVELQELSFIAGWNARWYSHFGRQFSGFLQN